MKSSANGYHNILGKRLIQSFYGKRNKNQQTNKQTKNNDKPGIDISSLCHSSCCNFTVTSYCPWRDFI